MTQTYYASYIPELDCFLERSGEPTKKAATEYALDWLDHQYHYEGLTLPTPDEMPTDALLKENGLEIREINEAQYNAIQTCEWLPYFEKLRVSEDGTATIIRP